MTAILWKPKRNCEAIQAFVESTQKYVTGEVKLKLYKGNIIKAGTTSPYSLYNESLASFTTGDMYDHHDADGFITLFGLPLKVRAMKLLEVEQNKNTADSKAPEHIHRLLLTAVLIFCIQKISLLSVYFWFSVFCISTHGTEHKALTPAG